MFAPAELDEARMAAVADAVANIALDEVSRCFCFYRATVAQTHEDPFGQVRLSRSGAAPPPFSDLCVRLACAVRHATQQVDCTCNAKHVPSEDERR